MPHRSRSKWEVETRMVAVGVEAGETRDELEQRGLAGGSPAIEEGAGAPAWSDVEGKLMELRWSATVGVQSISAHGGAM